MENTDEDELTTPAPLGDGEPRSPNEPLDLRERVIWVINESVGPTGRDRYSYLERRTGISARKWKNVCNRAQQPSVEMIAALARELRSHLLEWMVCGSVHNVFQVDPFDSETLRKSDERADKQLQSMGKHLKQHGDKKN